MLNGEMNVIEVSGLPAYHTRLGVTKPPYVCGERFTVTVANSNDAEYDAYLKALEECGAERFTENRIADNRFATYIMKNADGAEVAVHTMCYPSYSNVRIAVEPRAYLPETDPTVMSLSRGIPTTVTQPERDAVYYGNQGETVNGAPGMSFVIQLSDGSFILIDGGPRSGTVKPKKKVDGVFVDEEPRPTRDLDALYEFLKARTEGNQKPVIAAWFITHPHSDHVDLACEFLAKYKDAVEVKLGAYNFPDFSLYPVEKESSERLGQLAVATATRFAEAGAETWIIHTGQKMYFPGCEVEILYTPEDYYPKSFAWGNHTGCAFRMKFSDKTFMVLGDCEKDICQIMADRYGSDLKSELLQLSHHGVNGACVAIYRLIDPDICFWTIDEYRFETDPRTLGSKSQNYEFNAWIRNDRIKARTHYHNSKTATVVVGK